MLSTEKTSSGPTQAKTTTGLLSRTEIGLKVVAIPAILMGKPA